MRARPMKMPRHCDEKSSSSPQHPASDDSASLGHKARSSYGPIGWFSSSAGRRGASDREQVACAGVARRVAQLRHRPSFDLADALAGEVEVLTDFFERAGLPAIETEPQLEDLALTLVERREQAGD